MDHLLYDPPPPPEPLELTRMRPALQGAAQAPALAKGWATLLARLTRWAGPAAQA